MRLKTLSLNIILLVLVLQLLRPVWAPASGSGILFEDHFDYPDGPAPATLWKVLRPSKAPNAWHVESGEYVIDGNAFELCEALALHDPSWSNYRLRAKIRVVDYASGGYPYVGLLVRHGLKELAGGELRAYAFDVDPWVSRIILYVGGMPREIGHGRGNIKVGVDYDYVFECQGNVLRGYINGVKVVEAIDPDSTWTDGVVGLRSWGTQVQFDDVVVETLDAEYTLTMSATPGGTTNPTSGSYTYDAGTVIGAAAIADPGYRLNYWELDGVNVGASNPYSVTMDANHSLQAMFSPLSIYTLAITASTGGTTDPVPDDYTYYEGEVVTVTATADLDYFFHHWELDGAHVGSANPIEVAMDVDHSLNAVFSTSPPPPPILFEDHFMYPQGTVEPDGWEVKSGTWAVEYGEYSQSSMSRGYKDVSAGDPSWTDYSLQCNIRFMDVPTTDLYSAGLYLRFHPLNFYYFEILVDPISQETYFEIAKIVDGDWFLIARSKLSLPGGIPQLEVQYNIKVEVAGSAIRGYLNGALIRETFDSTFTNGQIGLYSFGCHAHFDDVIVETINP